jgi:type 1 fimbria pilin
MKRIPLPLTVALLTIASNGVLAASTNDLTINGSIIPAACTPTFSRNGLIDYGKISRQDLNIDKRTQLRDESLDLNINCNMPARFALIMRDNRDGSAIVNSEIYYGLNRDGSGNNIGLYSLNFDPTQTVVDHLSQVYRTDSTTGGVAWSSSSSRPIPIGARSYLGFTDVAGSNAGPIFIQNLSSRLTIKTVIAPISELDLSADVQLDGSATLDMVYF